MKQLIVITALIAILSLSFFACQNDSTDNAAKLPMVTCQAISNCLLKTTNSEGSDVYIDSKGHAYFEPRAAKAPFVLSGSGCLLGTNFFATVAHINPKTFDKKGFENLLKQADMEKDTLFIKNLIQSVYEKGLKSPDDQGAWEYYRVNSFIIMPNASTTAIQRSIENAPFKIPADDCIETEIENENETNDIAIYKLKKDLPKGITGFSLNDIANSNEFDKFKEQKNQITDVESWGYPLGIMVMSSNIVLPEPERGQVTKWPNASISILQTNLNANNGASGSFVVSKNQIIGIVSAKDLINPDNTVCVPSFHLYDMYKEALH